MTVKPLMAATDGSEESLRAVEWAAREAALRGAPLRIVSAVQVPAMINLLVRPDRDFVADLIREERDQALGAAAARAAEVSSDLVLVENSAIAVDLVFHADCWYSLISPASLGRSWIRSVRTGKGSTSGSSPGARRPMPWPWWLRPAL